MSGNVGNRLRDLLEQKNISQREFSKRCGVHEVSISRYISGFYHPRTSVLKSMADALGVTVAYLEGWEDINGVQEDSVNSLIESDLDFSNKLRMILSTYDEFEEHEFTDSDIKKIMKFIRVMIVED